MIPISSKTSSPVKVKTIKKHSKVNREILSKVPISVRPAVGDIEWEKTNVIETEIQNTDTLQMSTDAKEKIHNRLEEPNQIASAAVNESNVSGNLSQQQQLPEHIKIASDEDLLTMSLSINSESDSCELYPPNTKIDDIWSGAQKLDDAVYDYDGAGSGGFRKGEKTFGSSSGSDIALHEPGSELSDDDAGTNK